MRLSATTTRADKRAKIRPFMLWQRFLQWRVHHPKLELALFFGAGFLFDIVTLDRIDSALTLIQQAVYLALLAAALLLEQRAVLKGWQPPRFLAGVWRFQEDIVHFVFGSLLSGYALFYLKSASDFSALAFMAVLFALLLANELPRFRRLGPVVRFALLSICITTYFAYLGPVLYGGLSAWLFVSAVAVAAVPLYFLYGRVRNWAPAREIAVRHVGIPLLASQLLLVVLYFTGAIPPVPLAVEELSIYHDVQRTPEGRYRLLHLRPAWRIWAKGEADFQARPGDKVFCFVRVFAPTRFRESVQIRFFKDEGTRGWVAQDAIPLTIVGGRDDGFRGYAHKANYAAGKWRVQVQTQDGRSLAYKTFHILDDANVEPRLFQEEWG
ncbi:MAG: DUF2914 domain-containing protein [Myxococcaceae bacterium]